MYVKRKKKEMNGFIIETPVEHVFSEFTSRYK